MADVTTTSAPDPPTAIAEPTPYRIPLPSPSLFDRLEAEARRALEDELEWFSVPGGQILFEAGDPPDGLYLVLTGSLGIVRGNVGEGELMAQVHAGETVGALALLTAKPNSHTVIALRDTSLVRLNRIAFEKLVRMHPSIVLPMTLQIVEHLEHALAFRPDALAMPKTVALIPLDAGVRIAWLADALAGALAAAGRRVKVLDETDHDHIEENFYAIEIAHDLVIYRADAHGSSWTRMCIRRSDRVLLVAGAASSPGECLRRLVAAISEVPWRRAELVLLQAEGARSPVPAGPWLARLPVQFHCHVRPEKADIARLGRYLTGGAIGLVLSGGGARGYGHIGVIKALREAGIEVDLLGGTSIGSIMAAAAALEWNEKEFYERMHRAFVESNPLDDYTVPLVALTRGRKVTARLRAHFGEVRVEDLWRPFFAVATNLTAGTMAIQRQGPLWRALRASIAIPGLLPPVIEGDQVLADGAIVNNLPTDVMSAMRRGPVVGVDVTRYQTLTVKEGNRNRPIRNLLAGPEYGAPGIVSLLLRAGTLGGEAQTMMSRGHADVLLEPPLQEIGIRDWRAFDRAIEAGYRYTMERIGELEKLSRGATDHTPSCEGALGVTPASACRA